MNIRGPFVFVLKEIALTFLFLVCFTIASMFIDQGGSGATQSSPEQAGSVLLPILVVSFLDTLVLSFIVQRSKWTGIKLVATLFLAIFGVMSVMPQVESLLFLSAKIPPVVILRMILSVGIFAALFSPLMVLVLGKMKKPSVDSTGDATPAIRVSRLAWAALAISAAYVSVYYLFGYFVVWTDSAMREYYSDAYFPWWLPLFQVLRALMWAAIAYPIVRMVRGPWWVTALSVGLLFSVVMADLLLLPNVYMPTHVRMTHLLETGPSNFIFGAFVGWILSTIGETQKAEKR